MKKNILSIVTAGLLVSGLLTSAMASDSSSLTKATVKLIKENRAMTQEVMAIQSQQENVNSKIEQNKILIKNIKDDNTLINERFNSIKDNISRNESLSKQNASNLTELNSFKSTTSTDLKTIDLKINELGKKLGMSQENLEKINANSSQNSNVSLSTKEELALLKKEFAVFKENASKNLDSLSTQNTGDSSSIAQLNQRLNALSGENRNLKELLENYKIFTDAELTVLKTKLDRAKPVYFMQEKEVEVDCKTGNCSKTSSNDAEDVIKNYIK